MTDTQKQLRKRLIRAHLCGVDSIMVAVDPSGAAESAEICDWIDACEGGWVTDDEAAAVNRAIAAAGL